MKSDSIGNIAKALSQAQAEIKGATLDSTNPFLHNRYASLGSVIEVVRPVLEKYGLSYTQFIGGSAASVHTQAQYQVVDDGKKKTYVETGKTVETFAGQITISTILMHESGEWIESTVAMATDDEKGKSAAQVAGSVVTYLRRYALAAAFGVYAEEDTDGNGKQQGGNQAGRQQQGKSNGNGQRPASQPAKPMTVAEALAVMSPGNHRMGELTPEQLEQLSTANHKSVTDQMRQAAKIVLAEIASVQAGPAGQQEPQEQA